MLCPHLTMITKLQHNAGRALTSDRSVMAVLENFLKIQSEFSFQSTTKNFLYSTIIKVGAVPTVRGEQHGRSHVNYKLD